MVSKEIGLRGALLWLTLNFCANSMLVLLILRCVDYFYNWEKKKKRKQVKIKEDFKLRKWFANSTAYVLFKVCYLARFN